MPHTPPWVLSLYREASRGFPLNQLECSFSLYVYRPYLCINRINQDYPYDNKQAQPWHSSSTLCHLASSPSTLCHPVPGF